MSQTIIKEVRATGRCIVSLIITNTLPQYLYNHADDNLQNPLILNSVDVITCLHERDQLKAVKICYTSSGEWWVVNLYQDS